MVTITLLLLIKPLEKLHSIRLQILTYCNSLHSVHNYQTFMYFNLLVKYIYLLFMNGIIVFIRRRCNNASYWKCAMVKITAQYLKGKLVVFKKLHVT
jgi:hypothetical protein